MDAKIRERLGRKYIMYRKRQRPESEKKPQKFNIKLWEDEKAFLLRASAQVIHNNLSWYMVEASLRQAERDLGEKFIPAKAPHKKH